MVAIRDRMERPSGRGGGQSDRQRLLSRPRSWLSLQWETFNIIDYRLLAIRFFQDKGEEKWDH